MMSFHRNLPFQAKPYTVLATLSWSLGLALCPPAWAFLFGFPLRPSFSTLLPSRILGDCRVCPACLLMTALRELRHVETVETFFVMVDWGPGTLFQRSGIRSFYIATVELYSYQLGNGGRPCKACWIRIVGMGGWCRWTLGLGPTSRCLWNRLCRVQAMNL